MQKQPDEFEITRITPASWDVFNEASEKLYRVDVDERMKFVCNCPHFYYRLRKRGGRCKHIEAVIYQGAWNENFLLT